MRQQLRHRPEIPLLKHLLHIELLGVQIEGEGKQKENRQAHASPNAVPVSRLSVKSGVVKNLPIG